MASSQLKQPESSAEISRGDTWECNEARADPDDVPEPHDVELWEPHPRFRALVDRVQGDYVEMTVVSSNSHPRSPEFGDHIAASAEKLQSQPRWRPVDDE